MGRIVPLRTWLIGAIRGAEIACVILGTVHSLHTYATFSRKRDPASPNPADLRSNAPGLIAAGMENTVID